MSAFGRIDGNKSLKSHRPMRNLLRRLYSTGSLTLLDTHSSSGAIERQWETINIIVDKRKEEERNKLKKN
jgi:hypothetical protein